MPIRIHRLPCLPILLACTLLASADNTAPLLKLIPEASTDRLFPIVAQGSGRLKWSQGAFVYNTGQFFFTLNSEGDVIRKAVLDEPQDTHYFITDFDRRSDGSIVVAAIPEDEEASPFIAWIAPDGKTEKIIKTAPYRALLVTIAQDGTVWTLGFESIHKRTADPALDPSDGVLRQFDRGGEMIASALPQRNFIGANRNEMIRISHGKLCAIHEHLIWYSSVRGNARYVEIPTDKIELHRFSGVPADLFESDALDGGVEALTVMGTGNVVVALNKNEKHATFLLDRATLHWIRVAVPPVGAVPVAPQLIGTDGDRLVFSSGTSAVFFAVPAQLP